MRGSRHIWVVECRIEDSPIPYTIPVGAASNLPAAKYAAESHDNLSLEWTDVYTSKVGRQVHSATDKCTYFLTRVPITKLPREEDDCTDVS